MKPALQAATTSSSETEGTASDDEVCKEVPASAIAAAILGLWVQSRLGWLFLWVLLGQGVLLGLGWDPRVTARATRYLWG